jgi:hypothetical protein
LKIFIAPETGYKDRHFVDIMGCENTKQYPTILATYQLFTNSDCMADWELELPVPAQNHKRIS